MMSMHMLINEHRQMLGTILINNGASPPDDNAPSHVLHFAPIIQGRGIKRQNKHFVRFLTFVPFDSNINLSFL